MAGESPFDKLHVEPSAKGNLVGLLEQLNLPPKAVAFIRKNLKIINAALILAVVVSLSVSVYDTYRQKKINASSSALSNAMKAPEASRPEALQKVVADFPGTSSARWAVIELAHIEARKGDYKKAVERYASVRKEIKPRDPLFALVSFGIAQSEEAGNDLDHASAEYEALAKIDGYQTIGLLGMGRIHEMKGEPAKALSVYEQYMASLVGDDRSDPEKAFISAKIGRLKALQ